MKKMFLLRLFLLFSFLTTAIHAQVIQEVITPTQIDKCGESRLFQFKIGNNTGADISSTLLLDLPPGAYYTPGSITGDILTPTVNDISNLNKPIFDIDLANDEVVIIGFNAHVTCDFDITGVFDYVFNGESLSTPVTVSQLNTPNLLISNVTPSSTEQYVGATFTREITIEQNSAVSNQLSSFTFQDEHNTSVNVIAIEVLDGPGGNVISAGTFDSANSTLTFDAADIQSATGGSDGYFNSGETIYIRETIIFEDCVDGNSNLKAFYGCTPPGGSFEVCQEATSSAIVSPPAGTPAVDFSYNVVQKLDICQNMIVEITVENTGSAPAYNIVLPVGMANDGTNATPRVNDGLFPDRYQFVSATIGTEDVTNVVDSPYLNSWNLMVSEVTNDPDGVGTGLEDVNGDGTFELPEGESFTITVEVDYNEDQYLGSGACGNPFGTSEAYTGGNATWISGYSFDNMCGNTNYVAKAGVMSGIFRFRSLAFNSYMDNPNIAEGDITYLNASYEGSIDFYNSAFFDNGGTFDVEFELPPGLVFVNDETNWPVIGKENSGDVDFSTNTTVSGNIVAISGITDPRKIWKLPVTADCAAAATNEPLKVKLILNPGTPGCTSMEIGCLEATPSINFLCNPCDGNMARGNFTVERTSFGWLDADDDHVADDNSTRADASTPNVNIKAARSFEEVTFTLEGTVQNALTEDYVEFLYTHSGSTGATNTSVPYFYPQTATVTRTPFGGGAPTTVTNVTVTQLFDSASAIHTMQIDLDALQTALGTFTTGDSIEVVLVTKTGENLPSYYEPVANVKGQWRTEGFGPCFLLDVFSLEKTDVKNSTWFGQTQYGCSSLYTRMIIAYSDGGEFDAKDNFPNEVHAAYINSISQKWIGRWSLEPGTVNVVKENGNVVQALDDSAIDVSFDGTHTVFTYVNDGTMPLVDDYARWSDYGIQMRVIPDCGVPDGKLNTLQNISQSADFIRYYYAAPEDHDVVDLGYTETSGHAVNYFNLSKQFTALTGTYQATGLTAEWDVRYENTTNYSGANKDIENAWLLIESPSGGITPISIELLDASGNPTGTTYPLTQVGASSKWFVELGTITGFSYKDYRIVSTFNTCDTDELLVTVGNNCSRYPSIIGDELFYESDGGNFMCDIIQTSLELVNKPIALESEITSQPSSDQDFCNSIDISYNVRNIGESRAYNHQVVLTPQSGLDYANGSSTINYNGTITSIPDPTLISGKYVWDLDVVFSEIGFYGDTLDNEYTLNFQVKSTCGFISNTKFGMSAEATSGCGGTGNTTSVYSLPISLAGAPNITNIYKLSTTTDDLVACENNTTVNVTFQSMTGNSDTQEIEFVDVVVPANITYEGGYTDLSNNGSPTYLYDVVDGAYRTIRFQFNTSNPISAGETAQFSFNIGMENPSEYSCGDSIDIVANSIVHGETQTCEGQTCAIEAVTASSIESKEIIKQDVSLAIVSANSRLTTSGEEVTIDYTINNTGALDTVQDIIVSLVYDANGDNIYNTADGDVLITSNTITDAITVGETLNQSLVYTVSENQVCNLLLAITSEDNPCMCNVSELPVNSINLIQGAAGNNKEICETETVELGVVAPSTNYSYSWTASDLSIVTYLDNTNSAQPKFNYTGPALTVPTTFTYTVNVIRPSSGGCTSSDEVTITVNPAAKVPSGDAIQEFCESQGATVADLTATSSTGESIIWYDAAIGGNALSSNTILQDGERYYAEAQTASPESCVSASRLEVEVDILPELSVSTISSSCAADNNSYTLSIEVTGTAPYTVSGTGAPGTWVGNTWTSEAILAGVDYNITIKDANGCNQVSVEDVAPQCCAFELTCPTFPSETISCYSDLPTQTTYTELEFEALGNGDGIIGNHSCGVIEITATNSADTETCNQVVTRTYTITEYEDTNNNGVRDAGENTVLNTQDCIQTITIQDTTPPTFDTTPPTETIIVECTEDIPEAATVTATDNCGNAIVYVDEERTNETCIGQYTIERRWVAIDECGNKTVSDIQLVIVNNQTGPSFNEDLPADLTLECVDDIPDAAVLTAAPSECSLVLDNDIRNLANDYYLDMNKIISDYDSNEDGFGIIFSDILVTDLLESGTPQDVIDYYQGITVTLTTEAVPGAVNPRVKHNNLGFALYNGKITLTFSEPVIFQISGNPDLTPREKLTFSGDGNQLYQFPGYYGNNMFENDNIISTLTGPYIVYNSGDDKVKTSGQLFGGTGTLLIAQQEEPTASIAQLFVSVFMPQESDNSVLFEEEMIEGDCSNNYEIIRTWTATDVCGNETRHTQTITVDDTTAPTFVGELPKDIYGLCGAIPEAETLTATDNCGEALVTFSEYEESGACSNQYDLVREWVATDDCGNTSTHVQVIHLTCKINESDIHNAVNVDGSVYDNYFKIDGIDCFPDNTVKIFNRWGVEVYSETGYNNADKAFRGYSNGRATLNKNEALPTGDYYYIIQYRYSADGVSSEILEQSGFLYINNNK